MATSKRSTKRTAKQADGKKREKPGATGEGQYYHIEIRRTGQFNAFRTHDVGKKGGIQRVAGQREDGSWDTQKWLINKELAHVEQGRLIPDHEDARQVLDELESAPVLIEGDRFRAKSGDDRAG